MATMIMAAIAFIYVGFAASEPSFFLWIEVLQGVFFLLIGYYGWHRNSILLPLGLAVHSLWDPWHLIGFSHNSIPEGYELFCIAIDFLLPIYFFYTLIRPDGRKLVKVKSNGEENN
ncbi:MAG: hypothetical protein KDC80_06700 [Saprospiraceae bacterium]|nr:hypothetical protein [Saprospiraceae bacterium]